MVNRQKIDNYTNTLAQSFGKQLRERRLEAGLTQVKLAQHASISVRWLEFIEAGEKLPSLYVISSISIALDYWDWKLFSLTKF